MPTQSQVAPERDAAAGSGDATEAGASGGHGDARATASGEERQDPQGTLWVQDGGFVRPVR